ncbi:MAG: class I SAM-dependent methyltransferase [Burkholderiales bacterium]
MSLKSLRRASFLKRFVFKLWLWDARHKLERIADYLQKSDKLLDVGCGPGSVCLLLKNLGHDVTPLDVQDLSFTDEIKPLIYDGKIMPFTDDTFDVALLLTVLHHMPDPGAVFAEAKRVAKKIIVIEDIYCNRVQQYLTYFVDSLVNLEFFGHPHSNKSDAEWKILFAELGLKLKESKSARFLLLFRQATYYLERA